MQQLSICLSLSSSLPWACNNPPSLSLSLSHRLSLPYALLLLTFFISLALSFSADPPLLSLIPLSRSTFSLTLSIRKPPNLQPLPLSLSNYHPSHHRKPSIRKPPNQKCFKPSPSNSLDSLSVSRQHKTKEGNEEEEEKRKKKRREEEEKKCLENSGRIQHCTDDAASSTTLFSEVLGSPSKQICNSYLSSAIGIVNSMDAASASQELSQEV